MTPTPVCLPHWLVFRRGYHEMRWDNRILPSLQPSFPTLSYFFYHSFPTYPSDPTTCGTSHFEFYLLQEEPYTLYSLASFFPKDWIIIFMRAAEKERNSFSLPALDDDEEENDDFDTTCAAPSVPDVYLIPVKYIYHIILFILIYCSALHILHPGYRYIWEEVCVI